MFPNDDICSEQTARLAAMRLFRKYRKGGGKSGGLGREEVTNLMRATYQTINMPYNPNEEDIFSFMSVFDSNQDGHIDLKDIQQIAVKYLCGIQTTTTKTRLQTANKHISHPSKTNHTNPQDKHSEVKTQNSIQRKAVKQSESRVSVQQQKSVEWKGTSENGAVRTSENGVVGMNEYDLKKFGEKEYVYKAHKPSSINNKLEIEVNSPINQSSKYKAIYSPTYKSTAFQTPTKAFYSPKHIDYQPNNTKPFNAPSKYKLELDQVIRNGQRIFSKYASAQWKGILESSAGQAISETYEMFNKRSYVASGEDVKIWMKLCGNGKNLVDQEGYRHFLIKTYERQVQNNKN